jgi:hypothetical protein
MIINNENKSLLYNSEADRVFTSDFVCVCVRARVRVCVCV